MIKLSMPMTEETTLGNEQEKEDIKTPLNGDKYLHLINTTNKWESLITT